MRGIIAYVKKSFLIAMRYKFNIFIEYISPLLLLFIFYVVYNISLRNGKYIYVSIDDYTITYLKYLITGIMFSVYQFRILYMFCREMEHNKIAGYMEMLIISSTGLTKVIVAMFVWRLLFNFLVTLPYLVIGLFCIKGCLALTLSKVLLIAGILLLSFLIFCCMALFMAGLVLIFDQGLRFVVFFNQALKLAGGVFIPLYLFPETLRTLIGNSPVYIYITLLRGIIFDNYSMVDAAPGICKLLIYVVIMLPVSVWFFNICLKKCMIEGTLERY